MDTDPTMIRPGPRTVLAFSCTALLSLLLAAVFYVQDWQYQRPTPRPPQLVQSPLGAPLQLELLRAHAGRPVLLHFFNPDCPCSRFNQPHLRSLFETWKDRVDFVVVSERALEAGEDPLDGATRVIIDADGSIAKQAGVYATPQAVLTDPVHALFFRGNYNSSRYCTDEKTQYARLALEALATQQPLARSADAERAWGCELPASATLISRSAR